MIADEDAVDHMPKNLPQCDRSHGRAYGALLALKLVQSGVRHTCGGGHDIVCTSLSLLRRERGGLNLLPFI